MRYFDLHCDTLYEMYEKRCGFYENGLHISLDKQPFEAYSQIMAIWTKNTLSDGEAYERYNYIFKYVNKIELCGARFCTSSSDYLECEENGARLFLAVEGANLLGNDILRLDKLYSDGVRFLTLVWKGTSCIGGAWDTDEGLSSFGREVVKRCSELGIVVDLSHASHKMISECFSLSDKYGTKLIATHSNSASVCAHGRNLTDAEALEIARRGGLVGINFCPAHLTMSADCGVHDICNHITHFLDLGLSDVLCIGSDFDGVSRLPDGITGICDVVKIRTELAALGVGGKQIDMIFYGNAENFVKNRL